MERARETVTAELANLKTPAGVHRADFERERCRADKLMAELLGMTADAMSAKETAARLEGELSALRSRTWWKRFAVYWSPPGQCL